MAGLTSSGFELPVFDDVVAEINAELLSTLGPALDLSVEAPLGQVVAVFARREILQWEAIAAAYSAVNPSAAEGVNLDNVAALSGTSRLAATYSEVAVQLDLDATTTVPAGSLMEVTGGAASRFALVADVTSTSAGVYSGLARAIELGPVAANSGTLTTIVTAVSGWNSVTNADDADLGRNTETDTELRQRRADLLTIAGAASTDAIRADVLAVSGVLQCKVFENALETTDADGVPPHAFEVVVWDGTVPDALNADIAEAIWGSKPAGIRAFGVTTVTHTDDSGNVVNIGFTRSTAKDIYLDLTVTTNADFDTVNGPAAIKDLLVAAGNELTQGEDVVALVIRAAALAQLGVDDVPVFKLGFAVSPSGTSNLVIGSREIARFDTGNITVTVT